MNFLTLLLMVIPVTAIQSAYTAMPGEPSQADQKKDKSKEGPLLYPKIHTIVNEKGEKEDVVAPTRTLLIFLDDSEKIWKRDPEQSKTSTEAVCAALLQGVSPIILSASLLKNCLGSNDIQNAQKSMHEMRNLASSASLRKLRKDYFDVVTLAAHYYHLERWRMHALSPSLYLLIPPAYLKKIRHTDRDADGDAMTGELYDPEEITLGLKLPEATRITSFDAFKKEIQNSEPPTTSTQDFLDCLFSNKLFITPSYYINKKLIPQWCIFLYGHGGIQQAAASIPLKQFSTMLDFFNTRIVTKLLVYSTCYAHGTNYTAIFGDLRFENGKTYSYPIVSAGYSNEALLWYTTWNKKTLIEDYIRDDQLKHRIDFSSFCEHSMNNEPIAYAAVLQPIFKNSKTAPRYIRLPQQDFARPLFPYIEIGDVMVQTRHTSLDLQKYAQAQLAVSDGPLYVLITTTKSIPFEIVIKKMPQPPLFINCTEKPYYILDKVASDYSLAELIKSKMFLRSTYDNKMICIMELTISTGSTHTTYANALFFIWNQQKNIWAQNSIGQSIGTVDSLHKPSDTAQKAYHQTLDKLFAEQKNYLM